MPENLLDTRPTLAETIADEVTTLSGAAPPVAIECDIPQLPPGLQSAIAKLIVESITCIGSCGAPDVRAIRLTRERGRLRLIVRGPQGSNGGLVDGQKVVDLADALGGFARVDHTPFGGLEVAVFLRDPTAP